MEFTVFSDDYYMGEALKEAQMAYEKDEVPIGAIVVCHDQIIARAHNLTEQLTDVTAHAEMQAITAASERIGGKYLKDCTLYVTLEPCVMCMGALRWAQLGKLVIGAKDEKFGYTRFAPNIPHPKTKIISGIRTQECAEILTRFFKGKRK